MAWKPVHTGRDFLARQTYTKAGAVEAINELVWNGLDAEANEIDIDVETATAGPREMRYVTQVVITDNGHGMSHERAEAAFLSLGDSWKQSLNRRTVNNKRALHGEKGVGRFYVYSIGGHARWTSVSAEPAGTGNTRVEIVGEQRRWEGFSIEDPVPTDQPTGTRVAIHVEQGRSNTALLREDFPLQLTARLASHLMANSDIVIRVNGLALDPVGLIDGEPFDVVLDQVPAGRLGGHEVPKLTIVDWTDRMGRVPALMLCNENGMALVAADHPKANPAVKSTGYLCWSGFVDSPADLALAHLHHQELLEEATRVYEEHVRERLDATTATVVARMQAEGIYPYPTDRMDDPILSVERDMFDLVAVTARGTLTGGNRQQREMNTRLIKLALEERSESLDAVLAATLEMSPEERDQLAYMLRQSSLGHIVGAATEVTRRVDLILALRQAIYGNDMRRRMREIDQLHPLVKDNAWLFGEEWRLSRSEPGLTTVLRDVLADDALLEADLIASGGQVLRDNGRTGRLDLVLQRTIHTPGLQHRLVIELKRPSVALGDKELRQVRSYARALSKNAATGRAKWTFWLVGASISEEIEDDVHQTDREWGHVTKQGDYDIYVTQWGQLLDDAAKRLEFYREQLRYDISQEEAVTRVRERHSALLPEEQRSA
ncbi:ATP-binding protein [Saccharothrix sp. NRRL B-16314]|uniref:ATP-binding protein n=1 Tax=Saccharothrix sp. NRRL B-16314 TaxID=1463825 RepID=UPI000525A95A|nr:ATP-binding protein [Saccharothrix sp. NRRL B-16314]